MAISKKQKRYEQLKERVKALNLTHEQFQAVIRILADALGF